MVTDSLLIDLQSQWIKFLSSFSSYFAAKKRMFFAVSFFEMEMVIKSSEALPSSKEDNKSWLHDKSNYKWRQLNKKVVSISNNDHIV